jgi:3-oxoacyl-[acyl-carrier-protein] synthase-3
VSSTTAIPPNLPIGVLGTGSCVPPRVLENAEVAAAANVTPEWIVQRTGVRRRHVVDPGVASSDLAAEAVDRAVRRAGLTVSELDLIVLATSGPDVLGPASACRVQALLGAHRAVAMDVSAACTGWLFGSRIAYDYLRAGTGERYAAVVGVEVYSHFIDPTNRGTAVLFGDGAAAAVLGPVPPGRGFTPIVLGSDGTHFDDVLVPAGGSRHPATLETLESGAHNIHMDGRAVRDFILQIFPKLVAETLDREGLTLDEIDVVLTHQPNPALLREACKQAGIPLEKLIVVGDEVGNIGAGSLPYALAEADASGRLHRGSRALVIGFGAGLTWGSTVLTWSKR